MHIPPPILKGCSLPQEVLVEQSLVAAAGMLEEVLKRVALDEDPLYRKWFRQADKTLVFGNYAKMYLTVRMIPLTIDCACPKSDQYAFARRVSPFYIGLCGLFWTAPDAGRDSRPGVLIHELSHFREHGGTGDLARGYEAALVGEMEPLLPIFWPRPKYYPEMNADTYEYFAEEVADGSR